MTNSTAESTSGMNAGFQRDFFTRLRERWWCCRGSELASVVAGGAAEPTGETWVDFGTAF